MSEKLMARVVPLIFPEANERERKEFDEQMERLKEFYGGEADFLDTVTVGEKLRMRMRLYFRSFWGLRSAIKNSWLNMRCQ